MFSGCSSVRAYLRKVCQLSHSAGDRTKWNEIDSGLWRHQIQTDAESKVDDDDIVDTVRTFVTSNGTVVMSPTSPDNCCQYKTYKTAILSYFSMNFDQITVVTYSPKYFGGPELLLTECKKSQEEDD